MRTVVLFTRDLRVHDHPALTEAISQGEVVPLFVLDGRALAAFGVPNRVAFLLQSLEDLRSSLRKLGGDLIVRSGDVVAETTKLVRASGAQQLFISADASMFARDRERRLKQSGHSTGFEVRSFPGIAVVDPGRLTPQDGDHYRVFTPYWRAWSQEPLRKLCRRPKSLRVPEGIEPGDIPRASDLASGQVSPDLARGGETAGRERAAAWLSDEIFGYGDGRDDLSTDTTSRLSPYLHFGCLSANELMHEAPPGPGPAAFVRQLCWRDFYLQVLATNPDFPRSNYKERDYQPGQDPDLLGAWKEGRTGIPIVDAGMRQLQREGWMHNRARLITGSFLTRSLELDWRDGAQHFWQWLVDGDVANNAGNWQWVANTGNNARPSVKMNPLRQAQRFDRSGGYVRKYVPELAGLEGKLVHEPWRLPYEEFAALDYPLPLLDPAPSGKQMALQV